MKFEEMFKLSTTAMRINRCHPYIRRDKLWVLQFSLLTILVVYCTFILVYSIFFHDLRTGKYAEASKNGTMVIVAVTICFKYCILLYHQKSIRSLIEVIDKDYDVCEKTFTAEEKIIIAEYAERGVKICKLWFVLASGSSLMFSVKAFVLMGYLHWKGEFELVPMFDLTYPSFIEPYKDILPVFCVLFALVTLFACYASTMYLGFDPLVPIFMLHCCGQIEVISQRIKKILAESTDEEEIHKNFRKIIIKMQEVYSFVDVVKANFTILYEFTMKTTTFLVPLSAFQVVECFRNRDTNVEFIPFFFACLVHFYVPCHYSNLLMETSEKLRQAIYSCGWECHGSVRARKTVLCMLTRTVRPLVVRTVFFPLCLDTFAEMCRNSYAIFNIMTAAWN